MSSKNALHFIHEIEYFWFCGDKEWNSIDQLELSESN